MHKPCTHRSTTCIDPAPELDSGTKKTSDLRGVVAGLLKKSRVGEHDSQLTKPYGRTLKAHMKILCANSDLIHMVGGPYYKGPTI